MRIQNGFRRPFVEKAETILTAKPFAYVLRSLFRNEKCDHCLESGKLFKCSACQYVYYCDRNCQKEAWPVHKTECSNLKRIAPKVVPDMVRLMARIIVKLKHGGGEEVGYYSETGYRKFKDLMSHYSDIKKDEQRMQHFTCLCGVLFEFLGDIHMPNIAELMGIYGRICINSFNIFDLDMKSIGVGIYLGPSVMDHSCKPNAITVFDGPNIIIRTLEDIPQLDWSQIRISYIDVLQTGKSRREELKKSYYFCCDCEKCTQPEPVEVGAAACPDKSCTYPCSPDSDKCQDCGTKFPNQFKETFDEVSEFTKQRLQEMQNVAYLDVCKICLKKQDGVLHRLNVQHVKTLEDAYNAALKLQCWEEAESYARRLLPGYLLYYGEIHSVTGLLYLEMGKIQLYLENYKDSLDSLQKASMVLTITHGEKHSLLQENLKPLLFQATMYTMAIKECS